MGQVIISGGAGGGVTSDELTTTKEYVVKGKTYVGSDTNDEIGTGTLELTGTAEGANVEQGYTYYNKNPLVANSGTLKNLYYEATIKYESGNDTSVLAADAAFMTTNTDNVKRLLLRWAGGKGIIFTNTLFGYPASNFGDVAANHVLTGKYFTSVNGIKVKGTMTVNSLTSFKVAVASGRNVTLTWTVPTAASGKPFSGVHVRYKTGSAPTSTSDGTAIYTGTGSATASGATSTATVTMPNLSTTYYFSIWSYATINNSKVYSSTYKTASCTTGSSVTKTYTSSTIVSLAGYTKIDAFCVGAGGAGGSKYSDNHGYGCGGGGGYTKTVTNYSISSGANLTIEVGAGGAHIDASDADGNAGGTSRVKLGSTIICEAAGGGGGSGDHSSNTWTSAVGGNGGSGGGSAYGNGGTNGGNGGIYSDSYTASVGQGTTTRPWGSSSGTVYSGGGGGGGVKTWQHEDDSSGHTGSTTKVGYGGTTGGGNGALLESDVASGFHHRYAVLSQAVKGSANTGGGGGGGGAIRTSEYGRYYANGADGGSGIVLIKFY